LPIFKVFWDRTQELLNGSWHVRYRWKWYKLNFILSSKKELKTYKITESRHQSCIWFYFWKLYKKSLLARCSLVVSTRIISRTWEKPQSDRNMPYHKSAFEFSVYFYDNRKKNFSFQIQKSVKSFLLFCVVSQNDSTLTLKWRCLSLKIMWFILLLTRTRKITLRLLFSLQS
jgi:hypothetical protein